MYVSIRSSAALATAAIVGLSLVGCSSGPRIDGLGSASSTSQSSSGPSATPTLAPIGSAGPSSFPIQTSVKFRPVLRFQAPADWVSVDDADRDFGIAAPDGAEAGSIHVGRDPAIGTNDRDCEGLAAAGLGTTVKEIVAGLNSDARLVVTPATAAVVGGFKGQSLDVRLAPAWTGTCKWSDGRPAALLVTVPDPPGPVFGLDGPEQVRMILLDVGDDVVWIGIDSQDGSGFDDLVAQATPIVESFRFAP